MERPPADRSFSTFGFASGPLESFGGMGWQDETFGDLGSTAILPVGKLAVIDSGAGPRLYFGDWNKEGRGFNLPNGVQGPLPAAFNGGAVWDGTTLSPLGKGVLGAFGDTTTGKISNFTATTIRGTPAIFTGGTLDAGVNTDNSIVRGKGGVFWSGTEWLPQYDFPVNNAFSGNAVVKLDGVNSVLVNNGTASLNAFSQFDTANPTGIGAYDGTTWANSDIPMPPMEGSTFIRFNDGTGEALFACGTTVDIDPATYAVKKWDTAAMQWIDVSAGAVLPGGLAPGMPPAANVVATVFDTDGAGPLGDWLIIAGLVQRNDNYPTAAPIVLGYDGTAWHAMGDGLPSTSFVGRSEILSLAVHDDGSGPKLYASGGIQDLVGSVFRYDGAGSSGTWTLIGQGGVGRIRSIDLGSGPQLHFFGSASDVYDSSPNPAPTGPLARWTGTDWVGLNAAPLVKTHSSSPLTAVINDIAAFDDGSGVALYAVGPFGSIGGVAARGIARYTGGVWSPLGLGFNSSTFSTGSVPDNLRVNPASLVVFDDDGAGPTAPALYISGAIDNANGKYTERFARYGCPRVVCQADFNNSGEVTVQDIFDFLAAYFSNDSSADINGSGTVTVQDIFDFLSLYFLGCA